MLIDIRKVYLSAEKYIYHNIFPDGTTDVTRTLHYGKPTEEQRFAYTRVLMGCIDLSSLIFPSNLRISSADVVARAPLWQVGLDYMHGTGHGIGAFLGAHECKYYELSLGINT